MPTAFAADVLRRPIILIAAWLVVLQTFLAGVATAQAGAMLASGPLDAVICHGTGGSLPVDGAAPDPDRVRTLCCTFCGLPTAASAPVGAPHLTPPLDWERAPPLAPAPFIVSIARGAVRAGPSQAPPPLA